MDERILTAIIEETGLTRKEIRAYIFGKKREIEGITEFGALIIMCIELCVDFSYLLSTELNNIL
ncbi:MAG: hypothetical protein MUP85_01765 [Candidatus Lokiarchaeota archaeon]|nr:hypothetical protein [Candidatus Lokiarchaeota archaeon]